MSEEKPDIVLQLQRELNKARNEIDLLTRSLKIIQEHEKDEKEEKKELKSQLSVEKQERNRIVAENKECSAKLSRQRTKTKRKNVWIYFFALLFTCSAIVAAVLYFRFKQINESQSGIELAYMDLRETFPIKITHIEFCNKDKDGTVINDYGSTLYSAGLRYLFPKIHFTNYLKEEKTLAFTINYYNSKAQLISNVSSDKRHTSINHLSSTDNNAELSGWGNRSGKAWPADTYTVEIWLGEVCLGSKKFTIHRR
jgi:hypothetical protein